MRNKKQRKPMASRRKKKKKMRYLYIAQNFTNRRVKMFSQEVNKSHNLSSPYHPPYKKKDNKSNPTY